MSGRGWGNVIQEAEDMEEEKFVKMTEFEFQAEKTRAKDEKRFSSWNSWLEWARRIDGKRRIARIPAVKKTQLDRLMAVRNDYITEPNIYFAGPVQRDAELYRIDGQIRKLDGGRARVEKALEIERQQSLPEIHETIMRVHRQVAACHAVKRIIAGTIIAKFVVRHKPKKVVLSDQQKVLKYLGCKNTDHMDKSTFELFLKYANDDEKNGTIKGMSPEVYERSSKPMDLSGIDSKTLNLISEYLESSIKDLEKVEPVPKRFEHLGAFGKVNEEDSHWGELMNKLTTMKITEKPAKPVEMRWGIPVSAIKKIVVEDDPMEVEEEQPRKRRCVAQPAPMSQLEFRLTEEGAVQGRRARRRQRDYDANVHIYESVAAWGGAK